MDAKADEIHSNSKDTEKKLNKIEELEAKINQELNNSNKLVSDLEQSTKDREALQQELKKLASELEHALRSHKDQMLEMEHRVGPLERQLKSKHAELDSKTEKLDAFREDLLRQSAAYQAKIDEQSDELNRIKIQQIERGRQAMSARNNQPDIDKEQLAEIGKFVESFKSNVGLTESQKHLFEKIQRWF